MKIHALLFELECEPPKSLQLVVWLDEQGNGQFTRHAHPNKSLLDVEAGHVIVHRRRQHVVTSVKPYRTSLCRDESQHSVVKSGRAWMTDRAAGSISSTK